MRIKDSCLGCIEYSHCRFKYTCVNSNKKTIDAEEHEYLVWLAQNVDFGPAHSDVMFYMQKRYEEETGKEVPKNF